MSTWSEEWIWTLARSNHPFGVEVRRHLHRRPELSFAEHRTHEYLAGRLRELGYSPQTGMAGGTGLKAVLEGGRPGPTVALRADIDALPITEETGLEFASENPGIMHACGHDVHTAILLATARALMSVRSEVPGRVVMLFQPGEEKHPGGAPGMIRDGALENPKVDAIFGLHVEPGLTVGHMGFDAGPRMAAPDEFEVTVVGKGGHGAHPDLTVDPVLTAAQIITLLQQAVSRNVDPLRPAVVTVGMIQGGTAPNIIPDEVHFKGTIRTLDEETRQKLRDRVEAVIRGVCDAAGATYRFTYLPGYPVLVNDEAMTDLARRAASAVLGPERVEGMVPSMGGEDFAYYLQVVPGTFGRLGATPAGVESPHGLHTSRLMIDEEAIAVGVAYYLSVIRKFAAARHQE